MSKRGINVLSLFSGSEIGRQIVDELGIKINNWYSSEVDKYAIAVSKYHYKDIQHLGSVTEIKPSGIEDIDIIIGGSPCQSFSFCGKREGMITDENIEVVTLEQYLELKDSGFEFKGQSYLFWEYVRILKEKSPKYFLLENVVMEKKWEDIITNTLGVSPIEINSSLVSAQKRARLYWTNIPVEGLPLDKELFIRDVLEEEYSEKEILSKKIQDRFVITHEDIPSNYSIGTTKPEFRTIGQRDYVFGVNQKMGCLVATDYKQPKQVFYNGILRKASPLECERLQTLDDNYTKYGLFDGVVKEISNTQRYKMIGNGWTKDVVKFILRFLPEEWRK